ncbi:kinetochore-associated protein NSL1 homolog isoform X1 [Oncorhynchus tshawytscha]|uniref:kinetochore-associated protein NSL1 homolog isoform X1 n=1 Tax=Oncorhynchus tshawytscha TaxID=74940 RepID=UPI0016358DCC|nr:kinetochore-associated protein NSL1 homolog isoform X1 [Oncorhynchus tshawytscha]
MEICLNEEEEYRVKFTSKKNVVEQIKKYKELLKKVLNGQPQLSEEAKQLLQEELLANFETAVQQNVLINNQTWEEAPDEEAQGTIGHQCKDYSVREEELGVIEDECSALDDLLDENIVGTSRKRRKGPKEILPYVVRSLKAERKLMGMYEEVVKPQEMGKDPVQETIMTTLLDAAPRMFKQASAVMKSLQVVQQRAEGLGQVLNMCPTAESLEVFREVMGSRPNGEEKTASRTRPPIKRAMEQTELRNNYAPVLKRPAICNSNDNPE